MNNQEPLPNHLNSRIASPQSSNGVEYCGTPKVPQRVPGKSEFWRNRSFFMRSQNNDDKKRVGFYIRFDINYTRRNDLEENNIHIVIIDLCAAVNLRVINIYRSFRPPSMILPNTFFLSQLGVIRKALTQNCVLLGDFNVDACMENCPVYHRKVPLAFLTEFALKENSIQFKQNQPFQLKLTKSVLTALKYSKTTKISLCCINMNND